MKKKIVKVIIISILVVLAGLYAFGDWGENIYIQNASSGDSNLTSELFGNVELSQSFVCSYDGFNGVKVKLFRVGMEKIEGYSWRICDKDGTELGKGKIGEDDLNSNIFKRKKFLTLKIEKQHDSNQKEYILYLTGKNISKENCLKAYTTEEGRAAKELMINGKSVEQSLLLKTVTRRFNIETFAVFLGLALYVAIFFRFMYKLFR